MERAADCSAKAETMSRTQTDVRVELRRLHLRHTWTTTMASSSYRDTVHLTLTCDGITGRGEGAPILRYGTTPAEAVEALEAIVPLLASFDLLSGTGADLHLWLMQLARALGPEQTAALAACDLALCDWLGQRLNLPLYRYFGLDPARAPLSSFSIGIDDPAQVAEKVREAAPYPLLKIKVGLEADEETIAAVRSVTAKPLRVDANEGWTDPDEAIRKINWMATQGVELVEQPMPAHMLAETQYVRSRVSVPIFADEACTDAASIPLLRQAYDGVNVKLDKAGGMLRARQWIATARECGMQVMLGCMVSSSCACTAAAHLASLADFCDLDGSLLIVDDPFRGVTMEQGKLILPPGAGLGLALVASPTR